MHPEFKAAYQKAITSVLTCQTQHAPDARVKRAESAPLCQVEAVAGLSKYFADQTTEDDSEMAEFINKLGTALYGDAYAAFRKYVDLPKYLVGEAISIPGCVVVVGSNYQALSPGPDGELDVDLKSLTNNLIVYPAASLIQIGEFVSQFSVNGLRHLVGALPDEITDKIQEEIEQILENKFGPQALEMFISLEVASLDTTNALHYRVVTKAGGVKIVGRHEWSATATAMLDKLVEASKPKAPEQPKAPKAPEQPKAPKTTINPLNDQTKAGDRIRKAITEIIQVRGNANLDTIMGDLRRLLPLSCKDVDKVYVNGCRAYVRDYIYRQRNIGLLNITDDGVISFSAK